MTIRDFIIQLIELDPKGLDYEIVYTDRDDMHVNDIIDMEVDHNTKFVILL